MALNTFTVVIFLVFIQMPYANIQNLPKTSPSQSTQKLNEISPFCDSENYMQSPINIDTSSAIHDASLCSVGNELDWNLMRQTVDVIVKNTHQSLIITPIARDDALTNEDSAIKLNKETDRVAELSNYFNINRGVRHHHDYCFDSIRIHWGRNSHPGSEHTIDRKQSSLELHFVHFSCDFNDLEQAMQQWVKYGDDGKDIYVVAIVAVMFEIGEPNIIIQKILDQHKRFTEKGQSVIIQDIDFGLLMPLHLGYYLYDGTFTVPPCTPCVRWHVLTHSNTISSAQLGKLRTLLRPTPASQRNKPALVSNPNPVYECTHGGPPLDL